MALVMVIMVVVFSADPNAPPWPFLVFMGLIMALVFTMNVVPSLVAGYGLSKKKRWAKTACIIAGVIASMSAPVGTAVCIYTFWFLFSEPGKLLYDNPRRALPQQREQWVAPARSDSERQYVPPKSPPDWR